MSTLRSTTSWIRNNWRISVPAAAALIALLAYLAFGVFGFHTLFIDEVVDEANPFAAGAGASGMPSDSVTEDQSEAMNDAMADGDVPARSSADETVPAAMPAEPEVLAAGEFIDRSHPARGTATVLTDGTRRVLRFEDFETDNGPDLNVYLVAAPPDAPAGELASDFVDLGNLKGNIGDQNYEIGDQVDLDRYSTVVIWCVRFSVAFGAAGLG